MSAAIRDKAAYGWGARVVYGCPTWTLIDRITDLINHPSCLLSALEP